MNARRFSGALALLTLLSACVAPPPRPYPTSSGRAWMDEEIASEHAKLRGRAEANYREQKRRVERVGSRLLETIPGKPQVQFVIVNGDPSINAGATFGQVAITSGMLKFIQTDDEMAVVLGHELAHIQEGHVLKGAMSGLALNVLAIVLETQVPGAGQAAGGIGQLFLNRFSQSQERAADEVGLRYAYEAGFDPRAAVDVQERLAVETPQSMSAGYFDTHPSSVERAVAAREHARQLLAQGDPPGREEVLAMERADRPGPAARRRRESTYAPRDRDADPDAEPDTRPRARPSRPASESGSEDCRRAEVYADMARDAQGPAERKKLEARARRYCPGLADAGTSPRRSRDESDEPSYAY